MKYEITTTQYVAFLNTLTYNQQLRLSPNANSLPPEVAAGTSINKTWDGYNIKVKTSGNGTTSLTPAVYGNDASADGNYDQPDDALGYAVSLGTKQFLSFLDWAALRPMTEFEYEKACRGPLPVQVNEYAWGTTDYTPFANYSTIDKNLPNEKLSGSGLGLSNVQSNRNYRVGIAATATSNRVNAGATYYGMLDMTGGMHERVVGRHGTDYSGFTTDNGDGNLDPNGFSSWSESIIGARGGSWREYTGTFTSNRYYIVGGIANGNDNGDNWGHHGGRGVRSF
jgi:formylglycine-generating enzyme required for sulfatase activity